jgi:hypothetical protein
VNWWWLLADIVLIFVVAPTCIFFLNKVLRPILEIRAYADDILEHGVGITSELDAVPKLGRTRELAGQLRQASQRYAAAVQRLL